MIISLKNSNLSFVKWTESELTAEILAYYGKDWAINKKKAIDTFMNAFNSASWKNKVDYLFMPILSPSVEKLPASGTEWEKPFYNIRTKSPVPITTNNVSDAWGIFGINEKGIYYSTAGTEYSFLANIIFSQGITEKIDDMHVVSCSKMFETNKYANDTCAIIDGAGGVYNRAMFNGKAGSDFIGFSIGSLSGTSEVFVHGCEISNTSSLDASTDVSYGVSSIRLISGEVPNYALSIYSIGKAFGSQADFTEYCTMLENLYNALVSE